MAGIGTKIFGTATAATGEGVKATLSGIGGLATDIREAITGEDHDIDIKSLEYKFTALDNELAKAQAEITKAEAQGNTFQRSWRPGLAWIIVLVIGFQYLVYPLAVWFSTWFSLNIPPAPEFDAKELWPIILGLIGYRTIEKARGVQGS